MIIADMFDVFEKVPLPGWLLVIITLAVAIAGLREVWKGLRGITKLVAVVPVIIQIGSEFKTNGGSTLKDNLDRLSAETNRQSVMLESLKVESSNKQIALKAVQSEVVEVKKDVSEIRELLEVKKKSHR